MPLSEAQVQTLWKAVVKTADKTETFASEQTDNYKTLWDLIGDANLGDAQVAMSAAAVGHRKKLSDMLAPTSISDLLAPVFAEYSAALVQPEGIRIALDQAIARIRENFVANAKTIKTRGISFGAASATVGNNGNGTIYRCLTDEDGFPLESGHPEVKKFLCRQDQQQVEKHEEVFEIAGSDRQPDYLLVSGSGPQGTIAGAGPRASDRILLNQSFSSFAQTVTGPDVAALTVNDFSGWVLGGITGVYATLTAYRDRAGEADNRKLAMKWSANNTLVQYLGRSRRPRFASRTPHFVAVAVFKDATVTAGILTLELGPSTVSLDLSTAPTGWQILHLPIDKRVYSKNFTEDDLSLYMSLTGLTGAGGFVILDDVSCYEMSFLDGTFWTMHGGSIPFLKDDSFSVTDSVTPSSEGLLSKWTNFRSGVLQSSAPGFCIPTSATPTIADPV